MGNEVGLLLQVGGSRSASARSSSARSSSTPASSWSARRTSCTSGEDVPAPPGNPKAFLLIAAVLAQFTDPAAGNVPLQLLILGLVCVVIALVSDTVWALLAGAARTWLGRSRRRLGLMGGAAGAVMVGLGVQVALNGGRE